MQRQQTRFRAEHVALLMPRELREEAFASRRVHDNTDMLPTNSLEDKYEWPLRRSKHLKDCIELRTKHVHQCTTAYPSIDLSMQKFGLYVLSVFCRGFGRAWRPTILALGSSCNVEASLLLFRRSRCETAQDEHGARFHCRSFATQLASDRWKYKNVQEVDFLVGCRLHSTASETDNVGKRPMTCGLRRYHTG